MGFASLSDGDCKRHLSYLEKAKTKDKTIESLTVYKTGLARQQLSQTKEAATAYKQLVITDPTSPLAAPSQGAC